MKIFVSSSMSGFELFRTAARQAIKTLGHEPVMAEDFGAQPRSPQVSCLTQARQADVVLLVLGERYGHPQASSGLSPTHEEYRAARGAKPVLLFVQEGVERESQQQSFLVEAQSWQGGLARSDFRTPEELREQIIRALHRYEMAHAAPPVDAATLRESALRLARSDQRGYHGNGPMLNFALATGVAAILRPAELEAPGLADDLQKEAQFGAHKVFDKSRGVDTNIEGDVLVLKQDSGARILLTEQGSIALHLPLDPSERRRSGYGLSVIIEERVVAVLASAIAYADWILERVDSTHRITQVGIAAGIDASDYLGWRTQDEHDASPNSITMHIGNAEKLPPVTVDKPRAALRFDTPRLAEDLMVWLRRQRKWRP